MKSSPAIFLLAVFLLLGGSSFLTTIHAEDYFYRADIWSKGVLQITPFHRTNPISANWKSLIPEKYASISRGPIPDEHVTEFYNERDMFDNVELTFLHPAPEHLSEKYYYVISENGVKEVRIENVKAVIRFELDSRNNSDIGHISHWGFLIPEQDPNYENGFALISNEKVEIATSPIRIVDGIVIKSEKRGDIEIGSPGHEIQTSFILEYNTNHNKHIFIKFKPNLSNSSCYTRIHLVTADSEHKTINWNYSGCDI